MAEYLTTKEVAGYLRLNEKKVYALVAEGKLPAARISGKWLFPKHMIDQWVERNAVLPASGLMGALLDEMLVLQGSDDWLLSQTIERFQSECEVPVPSATIGSLGGLQALSDGLAHMAGCHVDNEQVEDLVTTAEGCYLINLFERQQGLMFDRRRHPSISGLRDALEQGQRWADRQARSGTYKLAEKLFAELGTDACPHERVGPFASHIELALAIRTDRADAGLGIQVAAEQCGLDFLPLHTERYKLAIPVAYAAHGQMARFVEFLFDELHRRADLATPGYDFEVLGQLEVISPPPQPPRPMRAPAPRPDWARSPRKFITSRDPGISW